MPYSRMDVSSITVYNVYEYKAISASSKHFFKVSDEFSDMLRMKI
jgi:hypothetical protein